MKPISRAYYASLLDVRFGNPQRRCNGVGICHIQDFPEGKSFVRPYKHGLVQVEFFPPQAFLLKVIKDSLLPVTRKLIFEREVLPVPEHVPLPRAGCIPAGEYPIVDSGMYFEMLVELQHAPKALSWMPHINNAPDSWART